MQRVTAISAALIPEGTRAVVLAGGIGARLRPYTTVLPKPLMPIGERPILAIVLEHLRESGVRRVTLSVGHLAELMMAYAGRGERWGLDIDYAREETPLGTIGPLALIPDLGESFLVMNGDVLTDLSLAEFWNTHMTRGAELTVATHHRRVKIDFGVLGLSEDSSRVTSFTEKPTIEHDVSMGIYAMNRSVLRHVKPGVPFGFDGLMANLLAENAPIAVHRHKGSWLDIGRPEDYDRAQQEMT